ncbi:laccase [Cyathus striatus]|nr:laccase [Cyathus striatus]
MVYLQAALLAIPGFLSGVLAETRNFDFTPDGFERSAVLINGEFPGPLITVNKGDSVSIPTHNQLTDPGMRRSTSIHWHGFFQSRSSCPIPPNTTFTYAFDTAGQTGNFWYHSHLSTQYCDGLRGVFVVYDMYDVDDESTIITLADWYHDLAPAAQTDFFKTGVVPIPDSGLINGVGRFVGGPEVPFAVVNVEQGKRYRLRVFAISSDGIEHDPATVQNIDIYTAISTTGGDPAGNPNFNPNLTLAILRYKGAPKADPTTNNPGGAKLLDTQMHPIASENPGMLGDGPADVAITLNISQPNPPFWDINGISYVSPTVPVLLQLLSGAKKPQDLLPSEQIFILPKNKLIEVSIPGTGAHPFHIHGHAFDVIRPSNVNETNFKNPLRRDVQPVNGGNMTFRFFSGNPGAWFLHCHIDWHLEAGLAVVFAEAPEDNISGDQAQIVPEDWDSLCPDYDALSPELQ